MTYCHHKMINASQIVFCFVYIFIAKDIFFATLHCKKFFMQWDNVIAKNKIDTRLSQMRRNCVLFATKFLWSQMTIICNEYVTVAKEHYLQPSYGRHKWVVFATMFCSSRMCIFCNDLIAIIYGHYLQLGCHMHKWPLFPMN